MKISVAAVLLALGATQALATDMSKLMQDAQAQVMMTPMTTLAEPLVSRYDDLNMHFSKNAALPTVEELAGSDMKVFSAYLFEFGPGENTPVQVTVAFLRMEREPAGSEYEGGLDPKKVEVFVMHSDVKTHADAKKALKTGKNVLAYKTAEPNNKYKYYEARGLLNVRKACQDSFNGKLLVSIYGKGRFLGYLDQEILPK